MNQTTRNSLQPMEGPATLGSCLENLLKTPGRVLHECLQGNAKVTLWLLLAAVICLAAFGLLLGSFSGGTQWWAAPAKVTLGCMVSALICMPSLYILMALSGATVRLAGVLSLLAASLALTGVLLAGFAPVLWVFSQSTTSLPFMGTLAVVFWLISLIFGLKLLIQAHHEASPNAGGGYVVLWLLIFVVVTLQMSTALRPIIGSSDSLLPKEKRFFLYHWGCEIDGGAEGSGWD
jgi:hypothetical protein